MTKDHENIVDINPSATFYYERAFDAFHKNKIDKGIKYFKRGVSLATTIQEEYYGQVQLALIYQHGGQFQASYDLLVTLIKDSHQLQPDLYYFQAVNCSYMRHFDEAREHLELFISLLNERNIKNNPYRQEAEEMIQYMDDQDI